MASLISTKKERQSRYNHISKLILQLHIRDHKYFAIQLDLAIKKSLKKAI